jgi:hypothetical protein
VAYEITRTYEIDPPGTVSPGTVRFLQHELASSRGVLEVSVEGDITKDVLAGLRVEVVVDAEDPGDAGDLARRAIRDALRSAGIGGGSLRVTSGSGRKV